MHVLIKVVTVLLNTSSLVERLHKAAARAALACAGAGKLG